MASEILSETPKFLLHSEIMCMLERLARDYQEILVCLTRKN